MHVILQKASLVNEKNQPEFRAGPPKSCNQSQNWLVT